MARVLGVFSIVALLTVAIPARADLQEEIKQLVPEASAMRQADFETLAQGSTWPAADTTEDKSLTMMLLSLNPAEAAPEQLKEFRYLAPKLPKPSVIAAEIYRVGFRLGKRMFLTAPVTFLQADRITKVTAEQAGDTVTGSVTFKAPNLYEGSIQYVAKRHEDRWEITEWKMPAYGIHLLREPGHQWQKK